MSATPLVTIGMPVYNGERFIQEALQSICAQTFPHFILKVSDNASTDGTKDLVLKYAQQDPRIRYHRNATNVGAESNFLSVAEDIQTPFFMWFACDDILDAEFLSTAVALLEKELRYGMAFSGIVNVDSQNRVIRQYSELPELSGPATTKTIARYVARHEIMGKANLIYSLYRTPILNSVIADYGFPSCWGGDMCFAFAAIARGGILIDPAVRFRKRVIIHGEQANEPAEICLPDDPILRSFPLQHYREYMDQMVAVTPKFRRQIVVAAILSFRHKRLVRLAVEGERGGRPGQTRSGLNLCADVAMSAIGAARAMWRNWRPAAV